MTEQTNTRFPAPLYAAAGAGDLAYQQLRKLPAVMTELSERAAASLRTANEQATTKAGELRERANTTDFDALRGNAASVATTVAQIAQDRAVTLYTALVARGERVVGSGVVGAADVVNADLEVTEEPKAVEAAKPTTVKATTVKTEAAPTPKPRKRATKPAAE
jgi:multidrug efflux pump subunit AcrA (membrane-fusion protein)